MNWINHSLNLDLFPCAAVCFNGEPYTFLTWWTFLLFNPKVGDSIVRKARETLEHAIKLVNESERWNCRVVYGDTDSLFVQVPGRNLQQAFKIGEEIRDAVTAANPKPIKLKLEKVRFFEMEKHQRLGSSRKWIAHLALFNDCFGNVLVTVKYQ